MHNGNELDALDRAEARKDRVFLFGLQAAVLETVGIFLRVTKLQRVLSDLGLRQRFELTTIKQVSQASLCRHFHVKAGRGNDPFVLFEVLVEDHFAGFRALDPEVFRNFATTQHGIDARSNVIGDPVHLGVLR
ncbi:hypothetical protein D3C80_1207260 [compost metagenome]